ncbi:MAG: RNA 2'-phosphotransferase [Anaerolineae bacterium]|nr:RNA 2'-phosphotransferase [Anaerolineae bacterium]
MNETSRREHKLRTLSRFLSMLLRHRPARFPVTLDGQGFTQLAAVMRILHALPNFRWATREDIDAVMALPGRARFEVVRDERGARIRALYGHTALRLEYEPVVPPDALYVAVTPESLVEVECRGLAPTELSYVHLAVTPAEARRSVLRLTATPMVLRVDAAVAHAEGHVFYSPTEGVYLVESLPAEYVTRL